MTANSICPEYVPGIFHLQWHITERCNLRCTHCYQQSYDKPELTFQQLLGIVEQFKHALAVMTQKSGKLIRGHITITGGEPLVRKDFFDLLEVFAKNHAYFDFSILSNGTLITEEIAERLKMYGPTYVQISMEGSKSVHESIRGKGTYDQAVNALKLLVKHKIHCLASFTSHKKNYTQFSEVVKVCKQIGVNRVWSDRLIPFGSGEQMKEYTFTPEETKQFFEIMKIEKDAAEMDKFCHTEVAMHRGLQFLCGGQNYVCQAGKSLLTIDVNGDVYPCRRMPIKIGNVLENKLIDIYYESSLLNNLRDINKCADKCKSCKHFDKCQGGLRCLSNAVTGSPFAKDPGCWID